MVTLSAHHGSIYPSSEGSCCCCCCVTSANPAPGACLHCWCWLVLSLTLLPRGFLGSFLTLDELHGAESVRRFSHRKDLAVEMFQSPAVAVKAYSKFTETFTEVLSLTPHPFECSMLRLSFQARQKLSSLAPTGRKFVSSCSAQWKAGLWAPASKPVSGVTPQPHVWCSIFLHHKAPLVTSGAACSSSLYCILHFDALFQVLNSCKSPIAH